MLDFYGYGIANMWTTSINNIQYVAYIKHLTNYTTVNMHILSFMHLNLSAHRVHLYSVYVFTPPVMASCLHRAKSRAQGGDFYSYNSCHDNKPAREREELYIVSRLGTKRKDPFCKRKWKRTLSHSHLWPVRVRCCWCLPVGRGLLD